MRSVGLVTAPGAAILCIGCGGKAFLVKGILGGSEGGLGEEEVQDRINSLSLRNTTTSSYNLLVCMGLLGGTGSRFPDSCPLVPFLSSIFTIKIATPGSRTLLAKARLA